MVARKIYLEEWLVGSMVDNSIIELNGSLDN